MEFLLICLSFIFKYFFIIVLVVGIPITLFLLLGVKGSLEKNRKKDINS